MDLKDKCIKISVIMPVCNVEKYLTRALESVTQQTLQEIEIIAVDDGSKDESGMILDSWAQKDPRIKVIHKANTGYGHSMNVGIDQARGEYIAVLEPDDYMKPDMLNALYTVANGMKADVVKSDFLRFYTDESGKEVETVCHLCDANIYYKVFHPNKLDLSFCICPIMSWCGIFNREFLDKWNIRHNETPGASYQDNAFNFQILMRAENLVFVDYVGYCYRTDNPQSSVKQSGKIYAINEEYAFLYGIILSKPELHPFLKPYWFRKYLNAIFALKKLPDKYKDDYIRHMYDEFKMADNKGELDSSFFTGKAWKEVMLLLSDIEAYKELYK